MTTTMLQSEEDEVFYVLGYASSGKFSKLDLLEKEIAMVLQGMRDGLERKKLADQGFEFYQVFVKKENVVVIDSSLGYRVIESGAGNTTGSPADYVEVFYVGKLPNGTVFDSNVEQEKPARFQLSRVVKGWRERFSWQLKTQTKARV